MTAQPLSATPSPEEGRCSTHPDRPVLGACTRCGGFYLGLATTGSWVVFVLLGTKL